MSLRLHYYSNTIGLRLSSIEEEEEEVYRIDEIKEFEVVAPALKEAVAETLAQGWKPCL